MCSSVQCIPVKRREVQFNAAQLSVVQCSVAQRRTVLHCPTLHRTAAVQCGAMLLSAVHSEVRHTFRISFFRHATTTSDRFGRRQRKNIVSHSILIACWQHANRFFFMLQIPLGFWWKEYCWYQYGAYLKVIKGSCKTNIAISYWHMNEGYFTELHDNTLYWSALYCTETNR